MLAIVIAPASVSAGELRAQSPPVGAPIKSSKFSGLLGVIRDSLERPISLARVFVDGLNVSTVSDDSGQFELRRLPAGPNGFTISRIGYAPVSFETSLPADSLVVLAIHMRPVQLLSTTRVVAERVNTYLARVGFVERQRLGLGSFLSPAATDSLADVISGPSQFLRGLRGIDLKCGGVACVPVSRGHAGCLMLFVDGAQIGPARMIDSLGLSPNSIAAVEVYDRSVAVPIEFQAAPQEKVGRGLTGAAGCGAIVLWTKARIPR